MADYYTQFSVDVTFRGKTAARFARAWLAARVADQEALAKDPGGDPDSAGVTFYTDWSDDKKTVRLWHDEYGRVDHAAEFIQAMMRAGHVKEPRSIFWAATCSAMRSDGFSGGGVLVTKDRLYWFVPENLIEKKWKDIQQRRKRFG